MTEPHDLNAEVKKAVERIKSLGDSGKFFTKYTPHGEVIIRNHEGVETPVSCERKEYGGDAQLPVGEHHCVLTLYKAALQIDKMGRQIPLTRNELLHPKSQGGITEGGVNKPALKKLIKKGLVQDRLIPVVQTKTKKAVRSQAVVYLTAPGRGYVRKFIDPKYTPEDKYGPRKETPGDSGQVQS